MYKFEGNSVGICKNVTKNLKHSVLENQKFCHKEKI